MVRTTHLKASLCSCACRFYHRDCIKISIEQLCSCSYSCGRTGF